MERIEIDGVQWCYEMFGLSGQKNSTRTLSGKSDLFCIISSGC